MTHETSLQWENVFELRGITISFISLFPSLSYGNFALKIFSTFIPQIVPFLRSPSSEIVNIPQEKNGHMNYNKPVCTQAGVIIIIIIIIIIFKEGAQLAKAVFSGALMH